MSELKNLYQTALARKNNRQEGSYTSYLYEKGLNKILKKIGEETTEVVVSAINLPILIWFIGCLLSHTV